jgi:hypothetical protein
MDITLKVLCEQIERILTGSLGGDRLLPTRNEIALHVRQGLGYLVKGEIFDDYKIDGQFFADDEYTFTIKDLQLSDFSDVKAITLPVLPVTLPKSRGIVAVTPNGYLATKITPILRKDFDLLVRNSRAKAVAKVVYFRESNKLVIAAFGRKVYPASVDVTLVYTPVGGMDEVLNINDGMQAKIIDYVISVLGKEKREPEDVNTDGVEIR